MPGAIGAEFDGLYHSDDLGETWSIRLRNQPTATLAIHRPRGEDLVLLPLYRDGFLTLDGTAIHFLRNAAGQVSAFGITTRGVHDLRFSRERHVSVRAP